MKSSAQAQNRNLQKSWIKKRKKHSSAINQESKFNNEKIQSVAVR